MGFEVGQRSFAHFTGFARTRRPELHLFLAQIQVDESLATTMYKHMVTLQTMDIIFYEAQRQGRFNFYMTTRGEEAINIASAAALSTEDMVFAQVLVPFPRFMHVCFCSRRFTAAIPNTSLTLVTVQGTRFTSLAGFHIAGICKPVLWERGRLWKRPANAHSLWLSEIELCNHFVAYCVRPQLGVQSIDSGLRLVASQFDTVSVSLHMYLLCALQDATPACRWGCVCVEDVEKSSLCGHVFG